MTDSKSQTTDVPECLVSSQLQVKLDKQRVTCQPLARDMSCHGETCLTQGKGVEVLIDSRHTILELFSYFHTRPGRPAL